MTELWVDKHRHLLAQNRRRKIILASNFPAVTQGVSCRPSNRGWQICSNFPAPGSQSQEKWKNKIPIQFHPKTFSMNFKQFCAPELHFVRKCWKSNYKLGDWLLCRGCGRWVARANLNSNGAVCSTLAETRVICAPLKCFTWPSPAKGPEICSM